MRTAAGLHSGDLLGAADIGDVEDAHAAETIFLYRAGIRSESLLAAVDTAVRHFDRHKHQILINRNIALAAGADHRRQQLCLCRVRDVVNVYAVKITHEKVITLKGKVRIRERQSGDRQSLRRRQLRRIRDPKRTERGFYALAGDVRGAELKCLRLRQKVNVTDP